MHLENLLFSYQNDLRSLLNYKILDLHFGPSTI